jgi:cyanophycin synthetase
MDPEHALVREHIRAGGRAVSLESGVNGQMITIYDHGAHIPLLWTHLIPATMEGRAHHNIQNAMVAAAMAFSMGHKLENIRQGLRTFDTTFFQAPGRANVFNEHPFKVILDYGHNPAAIAAMGDLVDRLEVKGRRIAVAAMPGDRRNEDIAAGGRALAGHFDHYFLKPDDDKRGRGPMEVPTLLRDALVAAGVRESQITLVPNEVEAVDMGLAEAQAGDLLVVFAD